jgi:4-hydroxy-tetrahydrodipicolinate synthase
MQLRGCGTALVTPFHQDGSIDDAALRGLVAWQIDSGIDFLVPCGTTGETPTLSHDEWLHVIDTTIEVAAGRVPILAGATSNATHEAVEKAKELAARPGVNAILTASPYYNKPTQEGLYRHYKTIAEAVSVPVLIYNVPRRTGVNVEPETVRRLSEIENIAGIKEASADISQMASVIAKVPESFAVLSGDDAIALPLIALGGRGLISVASNEIPAEMTRLVQHALNNDFAAARRLQQKYLPLMEVNFIETSPLPVKAAMAAMGLLEPVWRLPLCPPKPESVEKIKRVLESLSLLGGKHAAGAN